MYCDSLPCTVKPRFKVPLYNVYDPYNVYISKSGFLQIHLPFANKKHLYNTNLIITGRFFPQNSENAFVKKEPRETNCRCKLAYEQDVHHRIKLI